MSKKIFSRVVVQPHFDGNCFTYSVFGHYPDGDFDLVFETTSEMRLFEEVYQLELRMCCDVQLDLHLLMGY